jgi:hypothetical protein
MGKRGRILGALALIVGACGSNAVEPTLSRPSGTLCEPGNATSCTCGGGLAGTMVCSNNGQSYSECRCGNNDGGVATVVAGPSIVDAATEGATFESR